PLVAQTLARRGFSDVAAARAFLDPDHYHPSPPYELPNMAAAVERLMAAIIGGETICVWGDFDVDGQTSTTLLVSTLRDLGAVVRFYIPNRQRESHGIHLSSLQRLIAEGVDLLLTCDTGISGHEPIAYAQERGVDVVVTDHHDLPPVLPVAHALINPKMLPPGHPLRELPGVGCAYKLAEALYEATGRSAEVAQHLDLVALGIVADVAVQKLDTRYLLQRGLERLRYSERLGLRALLEAAQLSPDNLTAEHIGYQLAPRLNALGRLADASVAVEFFTTQDLTRARTLAVQMEGLNAQRKLLVSQVTQGAVAQIERDPSLLQHGVLVLSHDSWPGGVLGLVAGRLAETYGRPAILIATPPEGIARGSARSVPGCDISAAIARHQDLLQRFGGHPMAAGLSIDPIHIPAFRSAISETVSGMMAGVEKPALQIDGYLSLPDLSLDLVQEIERLAPFGAGNLPLTLVIPDLRIASDRTVGRDDEHLRLAVEDEEGNGQTVMWWQGAGAALPEGRFDLACLLRASDYRGQREVQVQWVDARPIAEPAPLRSAPTAVEMEVVDHRRTADPQGVLARLRSTEDVQIWAEATHRAQVEGRDRRDLEPHPVLVIWTAPPSHDVLQAALQRATPERVYLFLVDPELDSPQVFLQRLLGLLKRALREGGTANGVSVSRLAAATAQREATVSAGLARLEAGGQVTIVAEEDGRLHLLQGDGHDLDTLPEATARLQAHLDETAAYRAHSLRASAELVVSPASAGPV
ncbi:MAG TPA: single-stranded-DNA-specific exonuclease RecJ, partial [Anaerolineae bacterium]|nr:single-stranded-DNA-specific exonuclease RecJ [Anaerolineae bacterium]